MQDVIPQVSSQIALQQKTMEEAKFEEEIEEPSTKDAGVQTVLRESEAQTDPYTPDYRVREGENPEVLTLSHLTWGHGLPATFDELEQIEINREKKSVRLGTSSYI
jgi:hypothetical protein